MKVKTNKFSKAELNFLINSHEQFHPQHAYGLMVQDLWGINYPGTEISEYITGSSRTMDRNTFQKHYRDLREYLNRDVDPAGGYGIESHI